MKNLILAAALASMTFGAFAAPSIKNDQSAVHASFGKGQQGSVTYAFATNLGSQPSTLKAEIFKEGAFSGSNANGKRGPSVFDKAPQDAGPTSMGMGNMGLFGSKATPTASTGSPSSSAKKEPETPFVGGASGDNWDDGNAKPNGNTIRANGKSYNLIETNPASVIAPKNTVLFPVPNEAGEYAVRMSISNEGMVKKGRSVTALSSVQAFSVGEGSKQ